MRSEATGKYSRTKSLKQHFLTILKRNDATTIADITDERNDPMTIADVPETEADLDIWLGDIRVKKSDGSNHKSKTGKALRSLSLRRNSTSGRANLRDHVPFSPEELEEKSVAMECKTSIIVNLGSKIDPEIARLERNHPMSLTSKVINRLIV
ncbi:hypothetical protein CHS0354_038566 [Potamilus streckersoni]|uniref:Uncharacterized protein n=1 Tax=Potamilus streckersoni TaxID=2493646 RepID=A0AAE0RRU9_9BIVA|nr:hypothetical protein CHS0354_038566 [Potamilus streckersoni]